MSPSQTIIEVTEAVNDNPGFSASTAVLVKSKQQEFIHKKAKMKKRRRQYVDTGIKLGPTVALNPLEIGEKPPTDIIDDVETSAKACSMATVHSSSDQYN